MKESRTEVFYVQTSPEVFQTDPCAWTAQSITIAVAISKSHTLQLLIWCRVTNKLIGLHWDLPCTKLACASDSCIELGSVLSKCKDLWDFCRILQWYTVEILKCNVLFILFLANVILWTVSPWATNMADFHGNSEFTTFTHKLYRLRSLSSNLMMS